MISGHLTPCLTIGDVNAPDVIGALCSHVAQQVRVNRVLGSGFTRVRTGNDSRNAHLAHVGLHGRARNAKFRMQQKSNFARAIEGVGGVEFVNASFDRQLPLRRRHRTVEQARIADPSNSTCTFNGSSG